MLMVLILLLRLELISFAISSDPRPPDRSLESSSAGRKRVYFFMSDILSFLIISRLSFLFNSAIFFDYVSF